MSSNDQQQQPVSSGLAALRGLKIYGSVVSTGKSQTEIKNFNVSKVSEDTAKHYDIVHTAINDDDSKIKMDSFKSGDEVKQAQQEEERQVETDSMKQSDTVPTVVAVSRNGLEVSANLWSNFTKTGADLLFEVQGNPFETNKELIKTFSPILTELLDKSKGNHVIVNDVEPEVFEDFLKYLEDEKHELKLDMHANDLEKLAVKFGVEKIKEKCANYGKMEVN